MARRFICAAVVTLLAFGAALADTFTAVITKVEGNKVTFHPTKFDPETKRLEKGAGRSLEAAADLKVVKGGKYNKDTRKFENTEPVEGGLKSVLLIKIGEQGQTAVITTEGNKIAEIRLTLGKKKSNP
jgi:hypothetical protein